MVFLSSPYQFKFFKGCLPQISLGTFLNTFSKIYPTKKSQEKVLQKLIIAKKLEQNRQTRKIKKVYYYYEFCEVFQNTFFIEHL